MERANSSLRLGTGRNNREYFARLKGRDRRNLTDVLCALRDNGIQRVSVRGGSLIKDSDKSYDDIDLLITDSGSRFSLLEAIDELGKKKGIHFEIDEDIDSRRQAYGGTFVQDRVRFSYGGTI